MKTRKMMRRTALLVGAVVLSAGAAAAVAGDTVTVTQSVQYSPAQAESAAGAEKLYGQLERAASRVCKAPRRVLLEGQGYYDCTSNALAKAVKDVNIDAVAAIYLQKNKVADREGTVTVAKR